MKLTDTACKNSKPTAKTLKLFDGAGLYLEITPNGSKYWRLKYRFAGKEKRLALGVYPEVSLKEAREKRDQARKLLAGNIDPSADKKETKRLATLKNENTFQAIAEEWLENQKAGWTERHAHYVKRRLEADITPHLSDRPIAEIAAPELLSIIRLIEKRGAIDLAHRALQTCGQIFRYAIITGRAERDISADLKGALKTKKSAHHAHIQASELPEFLEKLNDYDGYLQTKLALNLLMLTMVRTTELRAAQWSEIHFDNCEWRIPAERMKMRQLHVVPLSRQSIAMLEELQRLHGHSSFIFPNHTNPQKCMSENTILYALYRMGYHSRATGHGFRATASTILNEHGFRPDVIERQLAHAERNKVRASYNHAQYLPERRQIMQWWADYLDEASKVKAI